MLLGATDRQLRLIERFAECFTDHRAADLVEHTVSRLVGQRVLAIALGYEDLIDHDQLRHDPVMAVLGGKLAAKRSISRSCRSVAPSSIAPASDVIAPPSNAATTARPSTGAKPNRSALHSVRIGLPPASETNRYPNTIFSDPGTRCTYPV